MKMTRVVLKTPGFLIIIISLLLVVSIYFFGNNQTAKHKALPRSQENTLQFITFQSKYLHIKITYSSKFSLEDKYNSIIFSTTAGNIHIGRNGTNFTNADDYSTWIAQQNDLNILQKNQLSINNLNTIRLLTSENQSTFKLIYYIYADGSIYTLSTESKNLFNDLEQMIQTFRYIP